MKFICALLVVQTLIQLTFAHSLIEFDCNHCKNGKCIHVGHKAKCQCYDGFTGPDCSTNIDDCAKIDVAQVCGKHGKCVDQVNGYYCECEDGSIGVDCHKYKMQSPCIYDNLVEERFYYPFPSSGCAKFLQCYPLEQCQHDTKELCATGKLAVGTCPAGLCWHQDLLRCDYGVVEYKRTRNPCSTFPCSNGGKCRLQPNDTFKCDCVEGFMGDRCTERVDYCASNPCEHGGTCVNEVGGYSCHCKNKIVDQCCCTGDENPCLKKHHEGGHDYFKRHPRYKNLFFHCNSGTGFVGMCPDDLIWCQERLRCEYQPGQH